MEPNKYLLYIDILGFSDAVKKDKRKIEFLYKVIDQLNVHKHSLFQTIVFSDTILIYNKEEPLTQGTHQSTVMYACEFVEDLLLSSMSTGMAFRAILTYGEFSHKKLNNIESYFGQALIDCYYKEKDLIGTGLFIDKKISDKNLIYKTTEFDEQLDFVYLLRSLERLHWYTPKKFPLNGKGLEAIEFLYLEENVWILNGMYDNINTIKNSSIRAKYIHTYHLYKQRYGDIIHQLEKNSFHQDDLIININWDDWAHHKNYSVYKNNCWE